MGYLRPGRPLCWTPPATRTQGRPTITHAYRPELDGLRSIAVYLVVLFHAGLAWADGGFIGVDLFFVLSGFLVSSVLLSEIDERGGLRLGRYYSRRIRRLLPAAVVTIVATCLAFTILWSLGRRLTIITDAQSALLYFANWHFIAEAGDYFATDVDASPFLHFWSLAIEEQFYAVFPLLLLLLRKMGRRATIWGLVAVLAMSFAAQVHWAQIDTSRAYYGTDTRVYQLFAGALLTVSLRNRTTRPADPRRAHLLAVAGLAGLLVLGSGLLDVDPSLRGMGATVVSAMLIGGLARAEGQPLNRLLGLRGPVFLGRISYGTYLWHWPVVVALTTVFEASPGVIALFALGIGTGLSALSYELLEMPIRRSQGVDRFRWPVVLTGVGASALLAITVVPDVLELDRRPALAVEALGASTAPQPTGAGAEPIPEDIDFAEVQEDVGKQHWCPASDGPACTVRHGSGPHVLFVGDSQAVSLVPLFRKLAREHDLTLSLNVLAGCPWQEGLLNAKQSRSGARNCEAARVGWYAEALPALDPDVVILLDRPRDEPETWGDLVSRRDGSQQPLARAVYETTRDTLDKVSEVADTTVVVERLVMPETFQPLNCLTSKSTIGDCAVPVPTEPSPSDGYAQTIAAQTDGVTTVNLTRAFCPTAPVCLPIEDDVVVWRDDHHYTAEYALSRSDEVWQVLQDQGILEDVG